jgi:S-adenosylmethionine-dependent methyltransferase
MSTIRTSPNDCDAASPMTETPEPESEVAALAPPFNHDEGFAWTIELPPHLQAEAGEARPALALFEDDRRLQPGNAMHADIRSRGGGAHAFWPQYLCFSTSQGDDPNANGHRYTVRPEPDPARNSETVAVAPGTESDVVALAAPFNHDDGFAWTIELPPHLRGDAAGSRPPLALFEDDRRLEPTNAMHADIRSRGGGAHAFWPQHLCFSASDGDDPNVNGHNYTIRREPDLAKNFRNMAPEQAESFKAFLIPRYFKKKMKIADGRLLSRAEWLDTQEGKDALADIMFARLDDQRRSIVPWLNEVRPLRGLRILEIGCGSGSSTLALAEQGAHVVGVDIDANSLRIAARRCQSYGVGNVAFRRANAADLPRAIRRMQFDMIIFYASLEHMSYDERLKALSDCWIMLPSSGLLCCTDTPNRLWPFDQHTSDLPFFNWLPDELAIRYARLSSRPNLRRRLVDFEPTVTKKKMLIGAGRGVSFHEFEMAIGPVEHLTVASCRDKVGLYRVKYDIKSDHEDLVRALMKFSPNLHAAWFFPALDIILEKPATQDDSTPSPRFIFRRDLKTGARRIVAKPARPTETPWSPVARWLAGN